MSTEIWFPIQKDRDGYPKSRDWEGLHGQLVTGTTEIYKILNVPFYLQNVAYNDLVRARMNPKGYFEFQDIIERGGWSVYRLLIKLEARFQELEKLFESMKIEYERDKNLVAIAVFSEQDSEVLVNRILQGKEANYWGAQDGYIFG